MPCHVMQWDDVVHSEPCGWVGGEGWGHPGCASSCAVSESPEQAKGRAGTPQSCNQVGPQDASG